MIALTLVLCGLAYLDICPKRGHHFHGSQDIARHEPWPIAVEEVDRQLEAGLRSDVERCFLARTWAVDVIEFLRKTSRCSELELKSATNGVSRVQLMDLYWDFILHAFRWISSWASDQTQRPVPGYLFMVSSCLAASLNTWSTQPMTLLALTIPVLHSNSLAQCFGFFFSQTSL